MKVPFLDLQGLNARFEAEFSEVFQRFQKTGYYILGNEVAEFEKEVDGILVHFGVQDQALLDIVSGAVEPSALLPLQLPASMTTVELQAEDVPHDMECHVDEAGNSYNFSFGLNWNGLITDERTSRYRRQ